LTYQSWHAKRIVRQAVWAGGVLLVVAVFSQRIINPIIAGNSKAVEHFSAEFRLLWFVTRSFYHPTRSYR
jgi:hypothetical protein